MNQQQFYDKMINRLDKMCASLDKIARTLEAMQKAKEGMFVSLTDEANVHLEAIDADSSYGNVTIE